MTSCSRASGPLSGDASLYCAVLSHWGSISSQCQSKSLFRNAQNAIILRHINIHPPLFLLRSEASMDTNPLSPTQHLPRRHLRSTLTPHTPLAPHRLLALRIPVFTLTPLPRPLLRHLPIMEDIPCTTPSDMVHRRPPAFPVHLPLQFLVETEHGALSGVAVYVARAAATGHEARCGVA